MKSNTNIVKINIGGYGGEFVCGTITKEQHDYWHQLKDGELEDYALDAFDYVKDNAIPKDMDFLEGNGWYECDNVKHNYGCDLESAWIDINLPDDTLVEYENAYELRDKYEDITSYNRLQYNPYEEMIRESGHTYTTEETSYPQPVGHYFTAYSSEKGQFIYTELKLPEHHTFDESKLVFFTTDIDAIETLTSIAYIFPDDSPNEPTELDNEGGDTRGKGWECSLFEVTPLQAEMAFHQDSFYKKTKEERKENNIRPQSTCKRWKTKTLGKNEYWSPKG